MFTSLSLESLSIPSGGDTRRIDDELLLRRRTVLLHGMIDDDASAQIIARLLYLEQQDDSSPIELHINSSGGSVTAGLALIDVIRDHIRPPVHTLCIGEAHGMAAIVLAAGRRGDRRASRHARISLTRLQERGPGDPSIDPMTYYTELLRLQQMLVSAVVEFTRQAEEQVHTDFQEGRLFTPEEAKGYGLIDEVLD